MIILKTICLWMGTIKDFLLMKKMKTINKLKILQDIPNTFSKMKIAHTTWIKIQKICRKRCTLIPAISNLPMKNGIKIKFNLLRKSNTNITNNFSWKVN
jgi:hypothetical protein